MPIIRVLNWPSTASQLRYMEVVGFHAFMTALHNDNSLKHNLGLCLRKAVVEAKVPGIDSIELVTVSFDTGSCQSDDSTVVIMVGGLFDRPERTKEIRDRLARKLYERAGTHLGSKYKLEVFISRFDPNRDSFVGTTVKKEA